VRWRSGQALLELALCAPVVVLLALGVAGVVQIQDAAAGLDAATKGAGEAASRAPDPRTADTAARTRFADVVSAYPLRGTVLRLSLGNFSRATELEVTSEAFVDVSWAGLVLPHEFKIHAHTVVHLEPWRTHRATS
jgi:Flp pilus assembly protein TadG